MTSLISSGQIIKTDEKGGHAQEELLNEFERSGSRATRSQIEWRAALRLDLHDRPAVFLIENVTRSISPESRSNPGVLDPS